MLHRNMHPASVESIHFNVPAARVAHVIRNDAPPESRPAPRLWRPAEHLQDLVVRAPVPDAVRERERQGEGAARRAREPEHRHRRVGSVHSAAVAADDALLQRTTPCTASGTGPRGSARPRRPRRGPTRRRRRCALRSARPDASAQACPSRSCLAPGAPPATVRAHHLVELRAGALGTPRRCPPGKR